MKTGRRPNAALGTAAPVLTAPSAEDEDDEDDGVLPLADVVALEELVPLTWLNAALRAARYVWFLVVSWYMSVVGMLLHWPMGLSCREDPGSVLASSD